MAESNNNERDGLNALQMLTEQYQNKIANAAVEFQQELKSKEGEMMRGYQQKVKEFEKKKEDMRKLNEQCGNIIQLNVGGTHFTTSKSTLCADKDSMLAAMFSGYHEITKCEDGSYFIDADGKHFRYILNYLRGKITNILHLPSNRSILLQLKTEANYFQVKGLESLIDISIDNCNANEFFGSAESKNFEDQNLNGVSFANRTFNFNVSFKNASLVRASFRKCQFESNINFTGADLKECDFRESDILNCCYNSWIILENVKNLDEAFFDEGVLEQMKGQSFQGHNNFW